MLFGITANKFVLPPILITYVKGLEYWYELSGRPLEISISFWTANQSKKAAITKVAKTPQ